MTTYSFNVSPDDQDPSRNLVIIHDLIKDKTVPEKLKNEIIDHFEFKHKITDLLSSSQTCDISTFQRKPPLLQHFFDLMHNSMAKFVKARYNIPDISHISMSASCYSKGDFLLCHDDLHEDRCVAYVYYLNNDWTERDGGALRFFSHVEGEPQNNTYDRIILPKCNTMVLFAVNELSHHEVEQVFSEKSRITLSGWFHSRSTMNIERPKKAPFLMADLMTFKQCISNRHLRQILRHTYRSLENQEELRKIFADQPYVLSTRFLKHEFYDLCVGELSTANWQLKGPPEYRKYDAVSVIQEDNKIKLVNSGTIENNFQNIEQTLPNLKKLVEMLISTDWMSFINKVTGLDLAVFTEDLVPPMCFAEIQRWTEGSYTLLCDNEFCRKFPTVDVSVFFEVDDEVLDPIINKFTGDVYIKNREQAIGKMIMNGKIIRSSRGKDSTSYYKRLFHLKILRHHRKIMYNTKVRRNERAVNTGNFSFDSFDSLFDDIQLSRKQREKIKKVTSDKIRAIKRYRRKREVKNDFVVPVSNGVYIGYNSARHQKFNLYMHQDKKKGLPRVGYYSVTVSYAMASKWNN